MIDALVLAGGILLLLAGGHGLVAGAITIARRLGVSTLVVGLTIVAMGTSAPELAFNVIAATAGHPGLSFGNGVHLPLNFETSLEGPLIGTTSPRRSAWPHASSSNENSKRKLCLAIKLLRYA